MKLHGISLKRHVIPIRPFMIILMAVLMVFFAGAAFSSPQGEHATKGEEHAAHATKGWVATDTYKLMNFLVLAIGLFYLLRKPAASSLSARISGIKNQLDDLESKKREAEKKLTAYDEKLSRLDKEAEKIVEDYVRQGNEAKARIIKEAEEAAERIKEQARRNIDYELERAKSKLRGEIVEEALLKAEEIIKSKITIEDQDRLVDEYLEKVVA
jgi:F-type H+-transporting ATPase subunit b